MDLVLRTFICLDSLIIRGLSSDVKEPILVLLVVVDVVKEVCAFRNTVTSSRLEYYRIEYSDLKLLQSTIMMKTQWGGLDCF